LKGLAFIFVFFFFVSASHSQVVDGQEIVQSRAILGDWDSTAKKIPVAIEFSIAKGWHMYWLNPGDAGSPPEVLWDVPDDWLAEKLQFPVPQHIVEDGVEAYGYYNKLVLYTNIINVSRRPMPNDHFDIVIKWVVCKDICVAGRNMVSSSYEALNIYHEWPKLPLVPTLEEAGYKFALGPSGYDSSTNMSFILGGIMSKIHCCDPIDDLFPYHASVIPISSSFEKGSASIVFRWKGPSDIRDQINGLIFIDDKAYWLKAR
jgi:hypothetical protein